MSITPYSPIYRKAFEQYLRKGTSIEVFLKAAAGAHQTPLYVWRTQEDSKVRPSHAANDGKIFAWDNPPPTGNPGEALGCRCWAEPYLGVDSVNNPGAGSRVTTSGKIVIIHRPDGSTETRSGGTPSWRNNNPGNIIAGRWADRHGSIGKGAGKFAVFPNAASGDAASKALLKGPDYVGRTIDKAIEHRSPPEENRTVDVQANVRKIGGFTGKEVIGRLNNEQLDRLVAAIKRAEGWREGTITITRASR